MNNKHDASNSNNNHETWTEASWTSVFAAPCWISPLYYSTTVDNDDHNVTSTSSNSRHHHHQQQQQQQQHEPLHNSSSSSTSDDDDVPKRTSMVEREDDEVLGWTLDASARGVVVMGTAVFVSSDLLRLAKEATGCYQYNENVTNEECQERVYGMRPSSVLAEIVMVVGLLSAVLMPLIGSIIDHTKYRRAVGSFSAAFMSVMILAQMLIMEDLWFVAAVLQIFVAFSYTVHLCATYAYLPELTTNHEKLAQYTARFSAAQYAGSVVFLILMVGVLSLVNRREGVRSSTVSQTVVFVVCITFFGYAWTHLFKPRPASQQIPENKTLISAGFWKIYKTAQTIVLHHSAIKWFLVSAAFTQAATTTFSTIAITYMTEQLGFSSRENGIAILFLLLFGVPGTRIAAWLNKSVNPIRSLQINLIFWICSVSAAAIFLHQPDQQVMAYVFAMFWGLAMGWVYPTEKTLYVTIIPRGQEAELMGTYICACQFLSWLPPMIFSVMNEMGFSMRIGIFSLTVYFTVSFFILFFVGDYDEAVAHAKQIDDGLIPFTADALSNAIGACYEQFADETGCQPGLLADDLGSTIGMGTIRDDSSTKDGSTK
ncbi:vacuole effluxer Atg22 like protein [Nitzschia inconspicua]|uniref:Vacuole effluxer Atg22 like protein n=1 Tax=Nitzschia inconspicua TaxID=303405 RepID=A0A9K3PN71_9STRA|nr:vacuole effluxer Atg22 like protein [Nitzschia inconspicua]